ncbi:hypothetical protein [Actinopolymorpha sp. B9G3]|uniref:hypothetical protein n=1 Tax=Actinopolymorpha sp. B9G3 TaxID=3158970 RepID=UPI0032D9527F
MPAFEERRALTDDERAVMERMLSVDVPGARELRSQLGRVEVVSRWAEGSISVNLELVGDAAPAAVPDGPLPVDAWAYDEFGAPIGTVLVWVRNGRLSALEFGWVTDEPPTTWPAVERIRVKG